jgi:MFS family permease
VTDALPASVAAGPPGGPVAPAGGAGVWVIALGQTTGYVAQTFAFAALIVALTDPVTGAGLPRTVLAAGPTLGLLVAALAAPFAGRLVDRGRGARLLSFGPLVGALGLVVAAMGAGSAAVWLLGFLIVGLGQATSQFETCFALLTRRLGPAAQGAIVKVTLVAGFSTTLAFPLGDVLARAFGWQGAMLALAAMQVAVTMPLNVLGTRLIRRRAGADRPDASDRGAGAARLAAALRGGAFWQLAGLLALIWMNHMILTTFALPVMMDRGAGHDIAVMLAAALGPAQVAGRLMLVLAGGRLPLRALTIWVLAGFVVGAAALAIGQGVPTLWLIYALVQGTAAGIASILRPVLAADILGREGFGAVWGALSVAPLLAQAAAPVLGAALLGWGGAPAVILACLAMAVMALGLGLLLRPRISAG